MAYASARSVDEGARAADENRQRMHSNITSSLANDQIAREMATQQEVNAAWKSAYAASQPAPSTGVSQDPTGPNLTAGQTQVQNVPASPNPVMPQAPLEGMRAPPVARSTLSAQVAPSISPPPPPPSAFETPSGMPPARPPMPAMSAQQPPQQNVKASPFDSPEFQRQLTDHLARMPNGGTALQQIKKERDAVIGQVMERIGNGHTDEARFIAERNGLDIPDHLYQNSNLAQGLTLAQKAYPDEPDKGQAFYQAFMGAQGDLVARVQAGMQAGGVPTPAAQRELNKSISLARFNASQPKPYVGQGGALMMVNPTSSTATPVTMQGTGEPAIVTGGYGLGRGGAGGGGKRFINVGGQLVDTQQLDASGQPKIVVPKNADPVTAQRLLAQALMSSGIAKDSQTATQQAQQMFYDMQSNPQGVQRPPEKPSIWDQWLGGQAQPAQPAAPAAAIDQGGRIHVRNPSTGDELLIMPQDLPAAQAEGYEQVQ